MNKHIENYPVFAILEFESGSRDNFSIDVPHDTIVYGMNYDEVIEKVIDTLNKIKVYTGESNEWDEAKQSAIDDLKEGRLEAFVGLETVYISLKNNFDYVERIKPKNKI